MAANTAPIFPLTPKSPSARGATANTNRDGSTGTYTTLFTAGANGSKFAGLSIAWEANSTAGALRLFKQDGGAGNLELWKEFLVPAVTFSAGVTSIFQLDWFPEGGIVLSASTVLKINTHIGENSGVHLVDGGDY